jgi:host factor-I protein
MPAGPTNHLALNTAVVLCTEFRWRFYCLIGPIGLAGASGTQAECLDMSTDKKQNLQDTFLNAVRKSRTPLTVFLVNGVKLQGVVTWFDNFCILLRGDGRPPQLVYKHAISTIAPNSHVQLFEEDEEDKA